MERTLTPRTKFASLVVKTVTYVILTSVHLAELLNKKKRMKRRTCTLTVRFVCSTAPKENSLTKVNVLPTVLTPSRTTTMELVLLHAKEKHTLTRRTKFASVVVRNAVHVLLLGVHLAELLHRKKWLQERPCPKTARIVCSIVPVKEHLFTMANVLPTVLESMSTNPSATIMIVLRELITRLMNTPARRILNVPTLATVQQVAIHVLVAIMITIVLNLNAHSALLAMVVQLAL